MTGKGEKQKGDETQLQGKDMRACLRVCVFVCVRARARALTTSAPRREAPAVAWEHPSTYDAQ